MRQLRGGTQQPEHAAASNNGGIGSDQVAEARAIHRGQGFTVQQHPPIALLICQAEYFAQRIAFSASNQAAAEIEYGDTAAVPGNDLNAHQWFHDSSGVNVRMPEVLLKPVDDRPAIFGK